MLQELESLKTKPLMAIMFISASVDMQYLFKITYQLRYVSVLHIIFYNKFSFSRFEFYKTILIHSLHNIQGSRSI
jgi:hypothetical protein